MAARSSKASYHCCVAVLLITLAPRCWSAVADSASLSGEAGDRDRTSVKKELRNPDKWAGSGLAEEEEIEPIKGVFLDDGAQMLAQILRTMSDEELGVGALQDIYDNLPFGTVEKDDTTRIKELNDRLHRKLTHYTGLVNLSRSSIEELFWHHLHRPLSTPAPCCELPESILRYNSHFGIGISDEFSCDVSTPNQKALSFTPGHNLTDVFSSNLKMAPSIKWQYFMGSDGGLSEYPAHRYDSLKSGCMSSAFWASEPVRRRDLYQSTVHPQPKFVVVVIDHGSALSPNQLAIAKAVGKYIVSGLTDRDHVGLVALADETHYAGEGDCFTRGMTRANQETKQRLSRFIDGLAKAKAPANHSLGFRQALDMARRALLVSLGGSSASSVVETEEYRNQTSNGDCPTSVSGPVLVAYISRGLLSSLAEPRQVLEIIGLGQACLQGRLVINTYALIDDGKPIMYEKTFLQDVALQNYSRYNVSFGSLERTPFVRGQALAINSTRWLSSTIGDYMADLLNSSVVSAQQAPTFSSPHWDPVGKGMVVSVTQPCFHLDLLVGVVGVDIHLADLVEDFTYFNQPGGRSYVFLIDTMGTVLMHPSLIRPSTLIDEPITTDIGLLESRPGFAAIRRRILTLPAGSEALSILADNVGDLDDSDQEDDDDESHRRKTLVYTWERVGPGYVAVMVTRQDAVRRPIHALKRVSPTSSPDLVYHRLDVVSSPGRVDLCRYFRHHSTLAAASLYLSPAAHSSSFQFESWTDPSPGVINSFMAYLGDKTKLIANPGLRPSIRSEVSVLTQLVPHWKAQFGLSDFSPFIVRRVAATPSGVVIEYPASVRPASYDPSRRHWYQKAIELPGRVVVTGPSLDPSGSGYIVTISHTVFEGKPPGSLHSLSDSVVAVLGADLTLSYMHRLLWMTLPFCPDRVGQIRGSNIRCFLMDHQGWLLSHPNLLDQPVEGQHLTHHEPLVASDLLNHDRFVVKKSCSSYADRTVQRFYMLNLTLSGREWIPGNGASGGSPDAPVPVLTNLVHGEHCVRYQIVAIPGTNLFVGIVNQTCESATAFCPCSTVDRLCLNCHRMEQSECECPCECPLELDTCTNLIDATNSEAEGLPTCPAPPEVSLASPQLRPRSRSDNVDLLPACLASKCEERITESECFGVVGCEWCVRDTDSHTLLQTPFCTQHSKCFGGILRGPSPYNDDPNGNLSPMDMSTFKSLPVGPVAGGVMAFFAFVALSVFCYRQQTRRRHGAGGYQAGGIGPGGELHMTQLDNMEDHDMEPDADDTAAVVSHEFGLANGQAGLDNVAIVSPYRVNTGYRRPAGGDSDHGYSTAGYSVTTSTPHEDSENTAASFVEPLLIGRDRYRPAVRSTSAASFSSRASSPLGPVYLPSSHRLRDQKNVDSPGTLHESADELEESRKMSKPPVRQLDDVMGMTILPENNQVVVPVTVHMVDTS